MKMAIGCDHGGFDLKTIVIAYLKEQGHEVKDYGCYDKSSIDYPDYVFPVAEATVRGEFDRGIVICTTGIGVSIAANKVLGVRCALVTDEYSARMTRDHNDTNMMALGAGVVGEMLALEIVDTWLDTPFSGAERHQRRIDKLMALEAE